MVNTHKKFPTDVKHNAYYEADGSDLRDATPEEREKYRLAALHKRKKPEAESFCGKSESMTVAAPEGQSRVEDARNSDLRRRDVGNSRDRDERGTHRRESRDKSGRTSSRDSVKSRGMTHRTAVGRKAVDERKRAGMRRERLKAATRRKRIRKALTTKKETDSRWRKSFDRWKLGKQRKK